jgi:cytochrome c oxidase subunit 2
VSAYKVGIVALVVGAIGTVAMLPNFDDWFPEAAATQADRHDTLYLALMIMSAFIMAIVVVFLVYSLWKFRAKPGDEDRDGEPIHGNTTLEIVWTVIPTIIVIGFAVYGGIVLAKNEDVTDEVKIAVTAKQFIWTFEYPDGQVSNELVLPVDRDIQFDITAETSDVIHSFYIPEFRVKADAPPGIMNHTYAHPTKTGTFQLICTELCGIGHSQMRAIVKVMEEDDYEQWLSEQPTADEQGGSS